MKYDPIKFPSPTQPPPDFVSPMMNQMMAYGSMRELTEEELARAVRLDPEQFKNLGPSLDMIKASAGRTETKNPGNLRNPIRSSQEANTGRFASKAKTRPSASPQMKKAIREAVQQEQLYDLELLSYEVARRCRPAGRNTCSA